MIDIETYCEDLHEVLTKHGLTTKEIGLYAIAYELNKLNNKNE